MEADVPMEDWEQIGILSGHRGLVLALAVYKDRLISGSGGSWKVPSCRCHSSPPRPPGAGSPIFFLAAAAQGPTGGCGAAVRPGQGRRSCSFWR